MPDRVADVLVADTVAASRAMDLHTSIVYYIIGLAGNLRRTAARINPVGHCVAGDRTLRRTQCRSSARPTACSPHLVSLVVSCWPAPCADGVAACWRVAGSHLGGTGSNPDMRSSPPRGPAADAVGEASLHEHQRAT